MNILKKSLFLAIFVLFFIPITGQAQEFSLSEIKNQLQAAALSLSNLSPEKTIRHAQLALIGQELNRISASLSHFLPQGRVLGATYPSNGGSGNLINRPLAEVEISPGYFSSNATVRSNYPRDIFSFEIEPYFSDIWVQSIEVTFDREIWKYLEEISLNQSYKTLFKLEDLREEDFSEVGDDAYAIRFSGFLVKIDEDRGKTFKIRVKAKESRAFSGIDSKIYLRNGAIRFIDEGNFNQQIPYSGAGERSRFSNTFTIEGDN